MGTTGAFESRGRSPPPETPIEAREEPGNAHESVDVLRPGRLGLTLLRLLHARRDPQPPHKGGSLLFWSRNLHTVVIGAGGGPLGSRRTYLYYD